MAKFAWPSSMSVGNAFLDAEHRKLQGMIDDVERAIATKDSANFAQIIDIFEQAVRTHFINEAMIAREIGHPFEQHQLEHRYVLEELHKMKAELIDLNGRWSESASTHYLIFLSNWAHEHIAEDDMLMRPKLESLPYDFRPEGLHHP